MNELTTNKNQYKMKAKIKDLNKRDKFIFDEREFEVMKKFTLWNKNDEPYLMTTGNEIFYYGDLEVERINKN